VSTSALLTDLYQLTMLAAYDADGMSGRAVFELSVRQLPPSRGFLVCAGLEQALAYLETLAFDAEELGWLRGLGRFPTGFVDRLAGLRFRGDVWAVPEGSVVFAGEPLLRVEAALPEAQLVESRLINLLHFETLIATKAARCVLAADRRPVVDFGMRRAHGAEAALLAARAGAIAGFAGTATVEAARRFGLPLAGTMAHSFVQAHADEEAAFRAYCAALPGPATVLIDTYDVAAAAETTARLVREGLSIGAVRIDSGDLADTARHVRAILDAGGAGQVRIIASGNLDEYGIDALVASGAPIDAFGVGTRVDASADAPTLDAIYKLVCYDGRPTAKRSPGKVMLPGAKQVVRRFGPDGRILEDWVMRAADVPDGQGLLECVMRDGRRVREAPPVADIAARAAVALATLPDGAVRRLEPQSLTPSIDPRLAALAVG